MKQRIVTKFGFAQLEVRRLHGINILIVKEDYRYRKGTKLKDGKPLKKDHWLKKGMILIPRREEKDPKITKYQIYERGLYEAIRGRFHTLSQYGIREEKGELQLMSEFAEASREIIILLLDYSGLTQKEFINLNKKIAELAFRLEKVRKPTKKEARDYFKSSLNITDSLGRINPSATGAKTVAAERRLKMRKEEIYRIASRLGMLELALITEKNRIEKDVLRPIRSFLASLENHTVFKEKNVSESEIMGYATRLWMWISDLETVDVEPFLFPVKMLQNEFERVRELLRKRQFARSKKILKKSLEALRLKEIQSDLEKIILDMSLIIYGRSTRVAYLSNLEARLQYLIADLKTIDEREFEIRCCYKVKRKLIKVTRLIQKNKLKEAKEILKMASGLL